MAGEHIFVRNAKNKMNPVRNLSSEGYLCYNREKFLKERISNGVKRRIRIQGISIFLALIISIIFFKYIIPIREHNLANRILNFIGIGMIILGFLFRLSARGYKQEKSIESKRLITTGPYTLMRNPMYFGSMLIGSGIIIALFNLWILIPSLIISLSILIPQIYKEEEKLKKQFGQEYLDYCKNTPRYFPRFLQLLRLDFREELPLKWAWIKKEFISWFLVIIGLISIEMWEDIKLFAQADYFKDLLEIVFIFLFFIIILKLLYGKNLSRKS